MTVNTSICHNIVFWSMLLLLLLCQTSCNTPDPIDNDLNLLQGFWEDTDSSNNISITIKGDSLYFYKQADFWYKATFSLPINTEPKQLSATIGDSVPPTDNSDQVVIAIYKIQDGILTLATNGGSDAIPASFANAASRYELRKVQPRARD